MKILLLNPVTKNRQRMLRAERCQVKAVSLWPPLALAYSAALMKQKSGFVVTILDAEAAALSHDRMIEHIKGEEPDLLIIQDTTPTIYADMETAEVIKRELPGVKICFTGLHSTVRPEDILNGYVDFCIRNEPEYTSLELATVLRDGRTDFSAITGLWAWS